MTIEFSSLTVLIGGNSCGKTTVLQALDFLGSASSRDIPEYLKEKGWDFNELKSELVDKNDMPIEFISEYQFDIGDNLQTVRWEFSVDLRESTDWTINEKIEIINSDPRILMVHGPDYDETIPVEFGKFYFQSSMLKYYNVPEEDRELLALKQFLAYSTYYGILSPDAIRTGKKAGIIGNIGNGGKQLASFVHSLDDVGKRELNQIVSDFMGIKVEVMAVDNGSRLLLISREWYETKEIAVDAWHTSDGLLRIIAFAAMRLERLILRHGASNGAISIKHSGKYTHRGYAEYNTGMMLLDEIEDGINPYLTEKVIALLRNAVKQSGRQATVTTHSPVMLNDFMPEEIVFLWKDKTGSVRARRFFDTKEMREALDFLNPGEIWENYGKDTILTKLNIPPEDK
jgi:predicted ATPase